MPTVVYLYLGSERGLQVRHPRLHSQSTLLDVLRSQQRLLLLLAQSLQAIPQAVGDTL